jgi:hypothetical protein
MGLLDGLLSINVLNCAGQVTGQVSVLGTLLQVQIGDVLYVKVNGQLAPQNCSSTPVVPPIGGTPTLPLSSVTPALPAAAAGSNALLTQNPTLVRRTGTCGTCVRLFIPLDRYGRVVTHPKRRSTTGTCLGSLTIPREQRTVKDRV